MEPTGCCPRRPPALRARSEHVAALKALAHLDRLRVFFHLVRAGGPVPANAIQDALGLPAPTLSHHLARLERAGLVARRRRERFVLSTVRRALVADLVRLLTACC
jgi:DNA-binding transcriptional ArsR family regulator